MSDQEHESGERCRQLLIAGLLIAAGFAASRPAHANCKVDVIELPVKMVGTRPVATVGINGTSVPLTVDSGAFFSMLTDGAAAQLALRVKRADGLRVYGVAGKIETRVTTVEKLQMLKGDFPNVQFVVGGNEPGAGTMGLMGRNMLAATDTEYDLANGVIRFLFPKDGCDELNMAYWAGSSPVTELDLVKDYQSKTPAIRTRVKLNGSEFRALFDTGATTVVTTRAAKSAGITDADLKPNGIVYGAGTGRASAWTTRFDKFELGGEAISNTVLRVADIDVDGADMLLGIDFFLSHRIYVSKAQSKMFVTYNGGPVFTLDRRQSASAAAPDADKADAAAASADQLARRGAASAARRDFESALADLNRACELEPTSAALFAQRGQIQELLKRPVKAREDFDRALALDPNQVDALSRRASLRLAAKDRDGAKGDLDALDRTLAPQSQMRLAMARLYSTLEQPAQALAELDQWIAAHPNDIQRSGALNSRCWARLQLDSDLEKALGDCDDAVDGESKNAGFLDTRGWVYLRLGKYRKALSDFDRSLEYRPKNAWTLYGRGLTKARLGDAAEGDADLAAARTMLPDIGSRVAKAGLMKEPTPPKL